MNFDLFRLRLVHRFSENDPGKRPLDSQHWDQSRSQTRFVAPVGTALKSIVGFGSKGVRPLFVLHSLLNESFSIVQAFRLLIFSVCDLGEKACQQRQHLHR